MVNHIGTWKYRFRMVSLSTWSGGTGNRNPAMIVYPSNKMHRIFHQDRRISGRKGREVWVVLEGVDA